MKTRMQLVLGFIWALPTLPGAIWTQRHEIVNAAFGKYVWLGKEGRREYEQHMADYEEWKKNLNE